MLFEDEHLLILDKPPGLRLNPDPDFPGVPALLPLLHEGIRAEKPWAVTRGLAFLDAVHRVEPEMSGVLVLAKSEVAVRQLNDVFQAGQPVLTFYGLVRGDRAEDEFTIDAPVAPSPHQLNKMEVDAQRGKRAVTRFAVAERFRRHLLLRIQPLTWKRQQVRAHLQTRRLALAADKLYRGRPLFLSTFKRDYRLKRGKIERPLISEPILHAERLEIVHPFTGEPMVVTAEWTKDLKVAVKYLRMYAPISGGEH